MKFFIICTLILVGCTEPSVRTNRIGPDDVDPLGGTGIDSQELRTICQRMARELQDCAELFERGVPRVVVQPPENRTAFQIDARNFSDKIRRLLIQHAGSRMRFLAREDMEAIGAEREAKRDGIVGHSGLKPLSGADYLLTGTIGSLSKQNSSGRTDYFSCRFRVVDMETSEILWEREYEFKKADAVSAVYR